MENNLAKSIQNLKSTQNMSTSELCDELKIIFSSMLLKEEEAQIGSGVEFGMPLLIAAVEHAKLAFLEVDSGNVSNAAGHTAAAMVGFDKGITYFPPHLSNLIKGACDEDFGQLIFGLEELLRQNWDEAHNYFEKAVIGFREEQDNKDAKLLSDWGR